MLYKIPALAKMFGYMYLFDEISKTELAPDVLID